MLERYKTAACLSEAISLSICYNAILLLLSVFCSPKTNANMQSFRTLLLFCLGINYNEFIMNAFVLGRQVSANCKSMQHLQSCLFAIKPLCFYTLTRLQIIQIAVKNQCKKKARGNPLHIFLNFLFQRNNNSLRVHYVS